MSSCRGGCCLAAEMLLLLFDRLSVATTGVDDGGGDGRVRQHMCWDVEDVEVCFRFPLS